MTKFSSKGQDIYINDFVSISRPELVNLGNHIAIDFGFVCTTGLKISDYVHISSHVSVIGGKNTFLEIEDFCFISTGARIICGSEKFQGNGLIGPLIPDEYKDEQILGSIVLKRFSGVCANSVVMPRVIMAEGSILGANSFLKQSTEPWTIYAGNPAKPIKKRKNEIIYKYAKKLGYEYA
jgi:acetyltransferase-like isoleucine patch superfamily enzyme